MSKNSIEFSLSNAEQRAVGLIPARSSALWQEERIGGLEEEANVGGQKEKDIMESVEEGSSSFSLVVFSVDARVLWLLFFFEYYFSLFFVCG